MPPTLFKAPEAWGLPSSSVGCLQVEAYLRLAGARFEVCSCPSSSKSPSGQLPAIENDAQISGAEEDELSTSRSVIKFAAKNVSDLDSHLTAAQRAELLAFSSLVQSKLDAATTYTIWCESRGYREYSRVVYKSTPFPLNYIIPWSQSREVGRRLVNVSPNAVYEDACAVLAALGDKLRAATGGNFFFGAKPSSLDALVFGHLAFYRATTVAAPVLQQKVATTPVLCAYLDYVMQHCFAEPMPRVPPPSVGPSRASSSSSGAAAGGSGGAAGSTGAGSQWSDAAQGQRRRKETKVEPTQAELDMRRKGRYWMAAAGTAIASYVLLSGRYVQVVQLRDALAGGGGGGDDGGGLVLGGDGGQAGGDGGDDDDEEVLYEDEDEDEDEEDEPEGPAGDGGEQSSGGGD